ncbi:hypothetical protein L6164_008064 [Bauhinia variegata]|uniref:Uncharacterized protein n=1 Tax=Bauhinia variegata TaxID=167791 RepID=A0ACB9PIE6_BAUVA|nr:hypothetical protein L6164_008064 [Bauhinia variegata]
MQVPAIKLVTGVERLSFLTSKYDLSPTSIYDSRSCILLDFAGMELMILPSNGLKIIWAIGIKKSLCTYLFQCTTT